MPVAVFSTSAYFHMAICNRYPGREHFAKVPVDDFPLRELAPICYITPTISQIHPAHLFVPGRMQAMTIAPYMVIQPGSFNMPPISCYPLEGFIWVNRDILRILYIHQHFSYACITNSESDWATFCMAAVHNQPAPEKYPVLWTPLLAVSAAKPGAIVELIHFGLDYRHYAVITKLIVADSKFALFRARLLGLPGHSKKLNLSPIYWLMIPQRSIV